MREHKIIDFTNPCWGHALHGWTMRECEAPEAEGLFAKRRQRQRDKKQNARYRSVMVHSRQYPFVGDIVRYEAERGLIDAKIAEVNPCGNPHDMHTLILRIVP